MNPFKNLLEMATGDYQGANVGKALWWNSIKKEIESAISSGDKQGARKLIIDKADTKNKATAALNAYNLSGLSPDEKTSIDSRRNVEDKALLSDQDKAINKAAKTTDAGFGGKGLGSTTQGGFVVGQTINNEIKEQEEVIKTLEEAKGKTLERDAQNKVNLILAQIPGSNNNIDVAIERLKEGLENLNTLVEVSVGLKGFISGLSKEQQKAFSDLVARKTQARQRVISIRNFIDTVSKNKDLLSTESKAINAAVGKLDKIEKTKGIFYIGKNTLAKDLYKTLSNQEAPYKAASDLTKKVVEKQKATGDYDTPVQRITRPLNSAEQKIRDEKEGKEELNQSQVDVLIRRAGGSGFAADIAKKELEKIGYNNINGEWVNPNKKEKKEEFDFKTAKKIEGARIDRTVKMKIFSMIEKMKRENKFSENNIKKLFTTIFGNDNIEYFENGIDPIFRKWEEEHINKEGKEETITRSEMSVFNQDRRNDFVKKIVHLADVGTIKPDDFMREVAKAFQLSRIEKEQLKAKELADKREKERIAGQKRKNSENYYNRKGLTAEQRLEKEAREINLGTGVKPISKEEHSQIMKKLNMEAQKAIAKFKEANEDAGNIYTLKAYLLTKYDSPEKQKEVKEFIDLVNKGEWEKVKEKFSSQLKKQ